MPSTIFSKPLNKQVAQNAADIAALSTSMGNANGAIAIVATGNTAPKAISAGQFVLWSGGLYTANSAIASGETLSSSNLTAVPDGGLNAVKSAIPAVVNNLTSDSTTSALSAAQGKALNGKIPTVVDNLTTNDGTKALSAKQGKTLNGKFATETLFNGEATDDGGTTVYNLSKAYTNYLFLAVHVKTNTEHKWMLIPTSTISSNTHYHFFGMVAASTGKIDTNAWNYQSACSIYFPSTTTFKQTRTYNNVNWIYKTVEILGVLPK